MARIQGGVLKEVGEDEPLTAAETAEELMAIAIANIEEVSLHGATLKEWKVLSNGMGFDLHFTVPLSEVPNLVGLTPFLQKLVEIKVTRYSRGLRQVEEENDGVNWKGVDDDG